MDISWWQLALSFLGGAAAGAFYFGGLYWTVRRLNRARRPAALAMASFLVRTAVTVAAIWFIGHTHWARLVASLVGLIVMRHVLVRVWGPTPAPAETAPEKAPPESTSEEP